MSEIETVTEAPAPIKAPAKKPIRRKKRAAPAPKPEKKSSDMAGLNRKDCCAGCTAKACVITGMPFCGHPFKGNLSSMGSKVAARINEARKIIAHQAIEAA